MIEMLRSFLDGPRQHRPQSPPQAGCRSAIEKAGDHGAMTFSKRLRALEARLLSQGATAGITLILDDGSGITWREGKPSSHPYVCRNHVRHATY